MRVLALALVLAPLLTACRPGDPDEDLDGSPASVDCDDTDAAVHPGATESCNEVDDDCDGDIDEADATDASTFYADADADGFGDAATTAPGCTAPEGYVADATDCDDSAAAVHPNATEVCNGIDDDCDGEVDVAATDAPTWYADADLDGFGDAAATVTVCEAPEGYVADSTDCDDAAAAVNPDADEVCNEVDDNCDGVTDLDAIDRTTWYADTDFDTYGDPAATVEECAMPSGYVANADDCDDANRVRNPGASEVCDGLDNDCDDALPDNEADDDGDGARVCEGDCNDADAQVNPSAPERCNDADDDCDGPIDEEAVDRRAWYVDADGDDYGVPGEPVLACEQPDNRALSTTDCDDAAADVNPGAPAVCSDVDHNCDGIVDGDLDEDGDIAEGCGGFDCDDADPEVTAEDCIQPSCKAYRQAGHTQSGLYTIDPDGANTGAAPFEVQCDMTTDGGGWTLTYWVNASHFDAHYANNRVAQNTAPTARNVQRDVWNVPSALTHSETLFFCTDNDNTPSYWRYNTADPQMWVTSLSTSYDYRNNFPTNATNSGNAGGCMATHKAETSYGFIVIDKSTSCGSCQSMLWGNYHYPSGRAECNSTNNAYGTHPSAWDNRTIGYPLCNLKQTSTGEFWIGVR